MVSARPAMERHGARASGYLRLAEAWGDLRRELALKWASWLRRVGF